MDTMTNEARRQPFIGIKITNRLQQQLDDCDSINERYFDGSEPQSLQIVTIDEEEILGRTVEQGASIDSLEDVGQNIRSILIKVCPKYNIGDSNIKVYARTIVVQGQWR